MPRLGAIPETGPVDYDWYARQVSNINRRRPHSAHVTWSSSVKDTTDSKWDGGKSLGHDSDGTVQKDKKSALKSDEKSNNATSKRTKGEPSRFKNKPPPRREPKTDYFGLDNSMKKLTLNKPRKWRPKDHNSTFRAWEPPKKSDKPSEKSEIEDDRASVMSVDRSILRKSRTSTYSKFKYPRKFHYGFTNKQAQLEENIPMCLRQYPRYSNQAVRQDCKYNPLRSVTHLNVHSVKSCNLPHPSPDGKVIKRKRPTSAPPGTMTSYSNNLGSSFSSLKSKESFASNQASSKHIEDLDRNGSYEFVYGEDKPEDEGPTHVILEVQDSDDEYDTHQTGKSPRDDKNQNKQDDIVDNYSDRFDISSPDPVRPKTAFSRMDSDNAASEELEIRDDTRRYSEGEYASSESDHSVYKGVYPDRDSDSAQSIEYEPDFS